MSYRFHFTDGQHKVPDDQALNLPDDRAALIEAQNTARDLIEAQDEDGSDWIIEVTDETDRLVVALRVADVR
jgi:hypothetical protein